MVAETDKAQPINVSLPKSNAKKGIGQSAEEKKEEVKMPEVKG